MRVAGIKATGLSKRAHGGQAHELTMASGIESTWRTETGRLEMAMTLRGNTGSIRLIMDETEMRDWYSRLGRALTNEEQP